jgi:chorismate mutase
MNLNQLREQLDSVDQQIIIALNHRRELVQQIFSLKEKLGMKLKDIERESLIRERYHTSFHGVTSEQLDKLCDAILELSQNS